MIDWLVPVLLAAYLIGTAEAGFRIGRRNLDRKSPHIGDIQGTVLGLLALLLGFTFSMALGRYDARRLLVVKEANAIGTTYLRASMLPAAHQEPVRAGLRRYVDTRLRGRLRANDPVAFAETIRVSDDIQRELWMHAKAAAAEAPSPVTVAFVNSLNEVIDTDAERVAAGRARIPGPVWGLLVVVAGFGCLIAALRDGADDIRSHLTSIFLPLLITLVISLILDLSQPLRGFISASQQPLIDLHQMMVR
jgi:hypothetical protein